MNESSFARLASVNVNEHVEKKGQFSYLSWPFAVAQLRQADPKASWEVRRFEGLPYLKTETGYFVEVAVTVGGVTLSQIHPVLDGKNKPIYEPSAFDINTSIQRCLVKAIALHGLGLYIYAGEDLPTQPTEPATKAGLSPTQVQTIRKLIDEVRADEPRLLEYFGVSRIEDLPASQYDRVVRSLERGRRKAA